MRTKRSFGLLLTLAMLSLFPASDPAEAGGRPGLHHQHLSGRHAQGESYLLTCALDLAPDQLELVREADTPESVPGFVPVQVLDPESSSLEMTTPEEFTFFRIRAFYGKELLLSEAFVVTEEPAEGDKVPTDDSAGKISSSRRLGKRTTGGSYPPLLSPFYIEEEHMTNKKGHVSHCKGCCGSDVAPWCDRRKRRCEKRTGVPYVCSENCDLNSENSFSLSPEH
ncbi:MAG: hypothetical protein IK095_07800 [Oscillospiraceae bacterium]|nr:hypothetical protein [Oscillospiraceae bacterium]